MLITTAAGGELLNRRAFVRTLLAGTSDHSGPAAWPIHLAHNENPYGPGARAREAIRLIAAGSNRYPGVLAEELLAAITARHSVPRECVLLSGGSGDVMRAAVYTFTSRTRALVTARPSYEAPMRSAQHIGSPVIRVPLTSALRINVAVMAARAVGAGLVYVCSPNNPTATVVPAADLASMIETIARTSPETKVLVDEAYFDYAEMPGFDTMIPLVSRYPQLIVTRTFSKIHGMAGMRVAYAVAQADTLRQFRSRHSASSLSAMSMAAATASLGDVAHIEEMAALNRSVRTFMVDTFTAAGYRVAPSDANFVFVDVRGDSLAFQKACESKGVHVGRPFPPLSTWARISVGTMDEMAAAMPVFMTLLARASTTAR